MLPGKRLENIIVTSTSSPRGRRKIWREYEHFHNCFILQAKYQPDSDLSIQLTRRENGFHGYIDYISNPRFRCTKQHLSSFTRLFVMGEEKIGNFFFSHHKQSCEKGACCWRCLFGEPFSQILQT